MAHPFHLAFPVENLETTRAFYRDVLGCGLGRSGDDWQDIDFFGSQIVAHLVDGATHLPALAENRINGERVPIPHFGAILPRDAWNAVLDRLTAAGADLLMPADVRYEGRINEQSSLFVRDPSGNVIEFKSFADERQIFAQRG